MFANAVQRLTNAELAYAITQTCDALRPFGAQTGYARDHLTAHLKDLLNEQARRAKGQP